MSVTDGLNNTLFSATYDAYGGLASLTREGATTTITPDSYGRPQTVVTPDRSYSISWTSPFLDVPYSVTDTTMSRTTTVTPDAWGRVTGITRSDGAKTSVTLDSMNRVTSSTDYLGNTANYTFDAAGRLHTAKNARGDVTTYNWRDPQNIAQVVDANSNNKNYGYSPRGDLASLTFPDGSSESYQTDADRDLSLRKNAIGQSINYKFDANDNLWKVIYPTGTGVVCLYDNDDRPTSMTDATGTTTWSFDAGERLQELAQPLDTLNYKFDQWGRRTSVTSSAGKIQYSYLQANGNPGPWLTSITSPQSEVTKYIYDPTSHLLHQQTNANGTYTSFGYDNLDRVTSIGHYTSSATSITSEIYTPDANGNITAKTVDGVTTGYIYDPIGQLTSETKGGATIGYSYDANGNRQTKTTSAGVETYTYSPNSADKLLSRSGPAGTWSYTYDAADRITGVSSPFGNTSLGYDFEDRVISVATTPTGGSATTTGYLYNGLDARVEKTSGSSVLNQFVRDGAGASDDMLWNQTTTFVPGVSERSSGTTSVLHFDRLGTPTARTNPSGTRTGYYSTDAFGNPTSGGLNGSQAGFAGDLNYQTDSESGLMLLGHRYYDSGTGRFITQDPIKAGRNWYDYCDNNPVGGLDPTGLQTAQSGFWNMFGRYFGSTSYSNEASMGFNFWAVDGPPAAARAATTFGGVALSAAEIVAFCLDPEIAAASKLVPSAEEAVNLVTGENTVYVSVDSSNSVQYVGITNDFDRRFGEHMAKKGISIDYVPNLRKLSRFDARAVEQVLIEHHRVQSGAKLLNKINSISPTNPIYEQSIIRGKAILHAMGYSGF